MLHLRKLLLMQSSLELIHLWMWQIRELSLLRLTTLNLYRVRQPLGPINDILLYELIQLRKATMLGLEPSSVLTVQVLAQLNLGLQSCWVGEAVVGDVLNGCIEVLMLSTPQ